ncbi:hypothetical protein PSTG_13414 [Puccinia striiformis f. sp. tritici PST-78]|uniref:Uncharacterized protein n=1 Tax=Puccinia striiformis f. sp. tritici PST-78 TaxID=1165861 RepID=A0A0L0V1T5_9BASI|nr:hypothetical protein PSTG_13414 [Puccinia striiformis f. sp. tritici PST-78]
MVSLKTTIIIWLQFPSIKLLVVVLAALCGTVLPLSSAPTPDVSDLNPPVWIPVEAFPGSTKTLDEEELSFPLSGETHPYDFPTEKKGKELGTSNCNSSEVKASRDPPTVLEPVSLAETEENAGPRSFRPVGSKAPGYTHDTNYPKPRRRDKLIDVIYKNWTYYSKKLYGKLLFMLSTNTAARNKWKDKVKHAVRESWPSYLKQLSNKLLSMFMANPVAGNKWLDKLKYALREDWPYYFKKLSRKLLSTIMTNTAAGNKWKIVNFDPIANITSIEIPKYLSSPGAMLKSIMNSPGDGGGDGDGGGGAGGGDITGLLNQIVSLAPIGPLVHRTELDLNFDLEQVVQLFFISPRESTTKLSSTNHKEMPQVTASESQMSPPTTSAGATDPLRDYLVDHPPIKGKSYIQGGFQEQHVALETLKSPMILEEAFSFWLSAALHQIHPFESKSWLSLCPLKFSTQNLKTLTPCVVTFTNSRKDHIQSIISYDLPLF